MTAFAKRTAVEIESLMGIMPRFLEKADAIWRLEARREMSGKTDQVKGRVKEAAGALVGDKTLEREGKVDRAAGSVKEKAAHVVDRVKKTTEDAVEKVKSTINPKS